MANIKEIISELQNENVLFSMISNGKCLTTELVHYLNENKVHVAISWDGVNSETTRGFDVVAEKEATILLLNNLCFTGVMSNQNYVLDYINALDEFDKKYFLLHGYHISSNVDALMRCV